jgi:hypothetical protein
MMEEYFPKKCCKTCGAKMEYDASVLFCPICDGEKVQEPEKEKRETYTIDSKDELTINGNITAIPEDLESDKQYEFVPDPNIFQIGGPPAQEPEEEGPKVITLCGSTRFTKEMLIKQWELTKQGYIVLSWCALPDNYYLGDDKTHIGDQEDVKELVDVVHKKKIDISDEILVLNINGYIGDSTRSEIEYAQRMGKIIKYFEDQEPEDD